jgi:hypothetical protein
MKVTNKLSTPAYVAVCHGPLPDLAGTYSDISQLSFASPEAKPVNSASGNWHEVATIAFRYN